MASRRRVLKSKRSVFVPGSMRAERPGATQPSGLVMAGDWLRGPELVTQGLIGIGMIAFVGWHFAPARMEGVKVENGALEVARVAAPPDEWTAPVVELASAREVDAVERMSMAPRFAEQERLAAMPMAGTLPVCQQARGLAATDYFSSVMTRPPVVASLPESTLARKSRERDVVATTKIIEPVVTPLVILDPPFPLGRDLSAREVRTLTGVIRELLENPERPATDRAEILFARGKEISREEPRLYHAMGVRMMREGQSTVALEYLAEARQRARGAYFAPWRDYIRLLTYSNLFAEASVEIEKMAIELERRLLDRPMVFSETDPLVEGNARFLGLTSEFLDVVGRTPYKARKAFVARKGVTERHLGETRLVAFQQGRSDLKRAHEQQRMLDETRADEVDDLEDLMIENGELATTHRHSVRDIEAKTYHYLHLQGDVSPAMQDLNEFTNFANVQPKVNQASTQWDRVKNRSSVRSKRSLEFEKLKMYRPSRADRFSTYEPMDLAMTARDILQTIPEDDGVERAVTLRD